MLFLLLSSDFPMTYCFAPARSALAGRIMGVCAALTYVMGGDLKLRRDGMGGGEEVNDELMLLHCSSFSARLCARRALCSALDTHGGTCAAVSPPVGPHVTTSVFVIGGGEEG